MTDVVELTRYPIDTDEVTYGTTWTPTDLERITSTSRTGGVLCSGSCCWGTQVGIGDWRPRFGRFEVD